MNRLLFLLLLSSFCLPLMSASPTLQVFFGTYTPAKGASQGIYTAQLDLATGALSAPILAAEVATNPTFLAWRPDGRTLFALSAATTPAGASGGALASYASLGDVIYAEPGAYVAFAGTRVAQQAQQVQQVRHRPARTFTSTACRTP